MTIEILNTGNLTTQNITISDIESYLSSIADRVLHDYMPEFSNNRVFVELIFLNDKDIQDINREYMKKDYVTDVLSFPLCVVQGLDMPQCIGSIMINIQEVARNARRLQHEIRVEIALLFIHAMLHIIGFDHESDNGEHREAESNLIHNLALPQSLIDRTLNT